MLEDLKSLIKDFEEVLIKDERFKNDYKFKSSNDYSTLPEDLNNDIK
jgi:hypothetical protein